MQRPSIGASVSTNPRGDVVSVSVPARAEYLHVVRTVVGSVAARRDLTIDAIEDLRIAVDEACAQLLSAHGSTLHVDVVSVPDGVEAVCRTDATIEPWPPAGTERSLASQVLQGLADEVAWEQTATGSSIRVGKLGVKAADGR
jgi:serine/threonine-protein kinase RsbW